MSKMGNYVVSLQESAMVSCPDCDGDGVVAVEVPMPHSPSRDVGYLDTRMEDCETCSGYGEIEREDEDE